MYIPYKYFRPYTYGADRMGICLYDPTVRVWYGSFVKYLQNHAAYILANGANKR